MTTSTCSGALNTFKFSSYYSIKFSLSLSVLVPRTLLLSPSIFVTVTSPSSLSHIFSPPSALVLRTRFRYLVPPLPQNPTCSGAQNKPESSSSSSPPSSHIFSPNSALVPRTRLRHLVPPLPLVIQEQNPTHSGAQNTSSSLSRAFIF